MCIAHVQYVVQLTPDYELMSPPPPFRPLCSAPSCLRWWSSVPTWRATLQLRQRSRPRLASRSSQLYIPVTRELCLIIARRILLDSHPDDFIETKTLLERMLLSTARSEISQTSHWTQATLHSHQYYLMPHCTLTDCTNANEFNVFMFSFSSQI